MNYCITTWHAGNAVLFKRILKQCNNFIQSIFYPDDFSKVDDVYRNYGILQVYDLFKFYVACFVHKHVNNQLPPCFENIFLKTRNSRSHQTRQFNNLYLPLCKNLFANNYLIFLELKFRMFYPKRPEA